MNAKTRSSFLTTYVTVDGHYKNGELPPKLCRDCDVTPILSSAYPCRTLSLTDKIAYYLANKSQFINVQNFHSPENNESRSLRQDRPCENRKKHLCPLSATSGPIKYFCKFGGISGNEESISKSGKTERVSVAICIFSNFCMWHL